MHKHDKKHLNLRENGKQGFMTKMINQNNVLEPLFMAYSTFLD